MNGTSVFIVRCNNKYNLPASDFSVFFVFLKNKAHLIIICLYERVTVRFVLFHEHVLLVWYIDKNWSKRWKLCKVVTNLLIHKNATHLFNLWYYFCQTFFECNFFGSIFGIIDFEFSFWFWLIQATFNYFMLMSNCLQTN